MEYDDTISTAFQQMLFPKVERNQRLKSKMEYLSNQYYSYKDSYTFPQKHESIIKCALIYPVHYIYRFWVCFKTSLCQNKFQHTKVWEDHKRQSS